MFSTILLVAGLVAFLAALGRGAVPRDKRVAWSQWTVKDLLADVVRGGFRLVELSGRNPMKPQKRTPFHR